MMPLDIARGDKVLLVLGTVFVLALAGCDSVTSTVTDQAERARTAAEETLSGALAPVKNAAADVTRRANQLGEGIDEVTQGIRTVRGALSGSGSQW